MVNLFYLKKKSITLILSELHLQNYYTTLVLKTVKKTSCEINHILPKSCFLDF